MNQALPNALNNLEGLFPDNNANLNKESGTVLASGNGGQIMWEKRLTLLEADTSQIKLDLTQLTGRSLEFATKGDLHKEITRQTRWIITTILAVATLSITVAKFLFV